jgi:signal transduction histidine kinase
MRVPDEDTDSQELSLRLFQPLLRYAYDNLDPTILESLAAVTQIEPQRLSMRAAWISVWQAEALLRGVRDTMASDEEFVAACGYQPDRTWGAVLLVLRAFSVAQGYRFMARTGAVVTRISHFTVRRASSRSATVEYRSAYRESRLMCLSRQGSLAAIPTLFWDMPAATVEERACIARGDARCEYVLRWPGRRSYGLPLLGAVAGAAAAALLPAVGPVAMVALPALGVTVGLLAQQRRLAAAGRHQLEAQSADALKMVEEHRQSVDEILTVGRRAEAWSALQEEQAGRYAAAMDELARSMAALSETRVEQLRRLSHDLRNPLAVIRGCASLIRRETEPEGGALAPLVTDLNDAVGDLMALLEELVAVANRDQRIAQEPHTVETAPLAARIERQLQAMVSGRDITVSVYRTRDCPETLEIRPLLFDRLVDNLLSNAAKYTDRGTITVELDGRPDQLALKLSDTGRGIGPERLAKVFGGATPDPAPALGGSHGVGLPNVVELLERLGGHLEVLSRPSQGTTFWVFVPVSSPRPMPVAPAAAGPHGDDGDGPRGTVRIRQITGPR